VLYEILIARPSVLAIFGVKALICIGLTLALLRGVGWARTIFAVLLAADVLDTVSNAWLFIGVPRGVARVPLLVGSEIAVDAVYAYAVLLLFSGPNASAQQIHAWIEGLHDFPGALGSYDFRSGDQHGLGDASLYVVRYDPAAANGDMDVMSDAGGAHPTASR